MLGPTLSARDSVVGVEALESLKLGWVRAAALLGSQALEDPEVSLGETWLFDVVRQTKALRGTKRSTGECPRCCYLTPIADLSASKAHCPMASRRLKATDRSSAEYDAQVASIND